MLELNAQPRTVLGKKTKSLRDARILPAVVYGAGMEPVSIAVSMIDFIKAYKQAGASSLLSLKVNSKAYNVLIHDVSSDPLTDVPAHADFLAVRMDKAIRAKVALEFIGESPAVKNDGGILVKVMKEVEVEALPADLPHAIQADLSVLSAFESKLTVSELSLPKGVKVLAESDEIVALVETPRSDEELSKLNEAVDAEIAVVKTEQEIKKEVKAEKAAETEV